jgi:hypothetical protein
MGLHQVRSPYSILRPAAEEAARAAPASLASLLVRDDLAG